MSCWECEGQLSITATDLEVSWWHRPRWRCKRRETSPCRAANSWISFVPCRRRCRVSLTVEGEKVVIKGGAQPFQPVHPCPRPSSLSSTISIRSKPCRCRARNCSVCWRKTHFSMAQQDVRYYLNGMLLEIDGQTLRAVATDGHRLALCETALAAKAKDLAAGDCAAQGCAGAATNTHGRGRGGAGDRNESRSGPDWRRSLHFEADRRSFPGVFSGHTGGAGLGHPRGPDALRQALQRTAILSNEKYRGIRVTVKKNVVTVQAHNPEQKKPRKRSRWAMRAATSRWASM